MFKTFLCLKFQQEVLLFHQPNYNTIKNLEETQHFKYQKIMDDIAEMENSKHVKMFQFEYNARESQQDKITSFFLCLSCTSISYYQSTVRTDSVGNNL
jgi:hypothetical protein